MLALDEYTEDSKAKREVILKKTVNAFETNEDELPFRNFFFYRYGRG
jgi:hypothetical protein